MWVRRLLFFGTLLTGPADPPAPAHELVNGCGLAETLGLRLAPINPDLWIHRFTLDLGLPIGIAHAARALALIHTPPDAPVWHIPTKKMRYHPWLVAMAHVVAAAQLFFGLDGIERDWSVVWEGSQPPPEVQPPCGPDGWISWSAERLLGMRELFPGMHSMADASASDPAQIRQWTRFLRHSSLGRNDLAPEYRDLLNVLDEEGDNEEAEEGLFDNGGQANNSQQDWTRGIAARPSLENKEAVTCPEIRDYKVRKATLDGVPPDQRPSTSTISTEQSALPVGTIGCYRFYPNDKTKKSTPPWRSLVLPRQYAAFLALCSAHIWTDPAQLHSVNILSLLYFIIVTITPASPFLCYSSGAQQEMIIHCSTLRGWSRT